MEKRQQSESNEQEIAKLREISPSEVPRLIEKQRIAAEKVQAKSVKIQKRQEKLLFVAFYILLNLAEDSNVERKMVRKDLIPLLMLAIRCSSSDLLVLAVSFLKKLSIYEENKNALKESDIVAKVARFLPCSSQPLMTVTLRLLFNLSFDAEVRDQCVQQGMIPKLVNLLKTPVFRSRTLKLLYQLSIEDRCKSMFTYTDGIPLLMGMIINFPQNQIAKELAGLAVNLSLNPRNAEIMAGNRGLNHLMDRMVTTKDPLLMKIIRNISQWTFECQNGLENPDLTYKSRGIWSPHIKNLCKLAVESENHEILVEILGTLANLTVLDLPVNQGWARILQDFHLLSYISKLLVPGMAQNDVLLEVVMLISAAAVDPAAAKMIATSNILTMLYGLWSDKGTDPELLLQLVYCFYIFFQQDTSKEEAMYGTRVIVEMMDCLHHKNAAVRAMADQALELVTEADRDQVTGQLGQLGIQIRKKRFEAYNQKWLAEVSNDDMPNNNNRMAGGMMDGEYLMDDEFVSKIDGDEDDEDIAWRALMQHKQQNQIASIASDKVGYFREHSYEYDNNNDIRGTVASPLSGDSNDEDSWEAKRQYK